MRKWEPSDREVTRLSFAVKSDASSLRLWRDACSFGPATGIGVAIAFCCNHTFSIVDVMKRSQASTVERLAKGLQYLAAGRLRVLDDKKAFDNGP